MSQNVDGRAALPDVKSDPFTFVGEAIDSMARAAKEVTVIDGLIRHSDSLRTALDLLKNGPTQRLLEGVSGWFRPIDVEASISALRAARLPLHEKRNLLVLELRQTGTALAAALELIGIDAKPILRLIVLTKSEMMERMYAALRRLQRDVDVRKNRIAMEKSGTFSVSTETGYWREATTRAKRRRRREVEVKGLTERQLEALSLHSEFEGNVQAAAKRMNVSRATFDEHYKAALRKLSRVAIKKAKTVRLPADHRGQAAITRDHRVATDDPE